MADSTDSWQRKSELVLPKYPPEDPNQDGRPEDPVFKPELPKYRPDPSEHEPILPKYRPPSSSDPDSKVRSCGFPKIYPLKRYLD